MKNTITWKGNISQRKATPPKQDLELRTHADDTANAIVEVRGVKLRDKFVVVPGNKRAANRGSALAPNAGECLHSLDTRTAAPRGMPWRPNRARPVIANVTANFPRTLNRDFSGKNRGTPLFLPLEFIGVKLEKWKLRVSNLLVFVCAQVGE